MPIDPAAQARLDDDAVVERMARAIHEHYRSDLEATGAERGGPADRPWDELPKDLQAQNWNQARANARRIGRPSGPRGLGLDLRIVVADGFEGALLDQLDAADVERLAIDEHDRWVDQKQVKGYVWGATRVDHGDDLRHPDLVAWEDLDEPTRDKDRAPMVRLLAVLRVVGLGVAEPSR